MYFFPAACFRRQPFVGVAGVQPDSVHWPQHSSPAEWLIAYAFYGELFLPTETASPRADSLGLMCPLVPVEKACSKWLTDMGCIKLGPLVSSTVVDNSMMPQPLSWNRPRLDFGQISILLGFFRCPTLFLSHPYLCFPESLPHSFTYTGIRVWCLLLGNIN